MQYRLYRDGEINFILQAPDNKTIAVFSVHELEGGFYQGIMTDVRKFTAVREIIYHGEDKQLALAAVHDVAKYFAKQLDPNFQDLTHLQIGKLEKEAQTPNLSPQSP